MAADGELAGIVAEDDGITQQPVCPDTAPQRTLGGDLHRIGGDRQRGDAEPLKMREPGGLIGELPLWLLGQHADHWPGECAFTQVIQRGGIAHVIGVAGTQQLEKVAPALAARGAKPGKAIVADLRAHVVAALMARAGIVHRDPGGGLQSRP